jgi:hypothetical protein
MKKNIIVLILAIAASLSTIGQSLKIPVVVKAAINTKFPNATNVKWGKENAKEYEAEFKLNNTAVSANFNLDGSWVETETTISANALPTAVATAITKKYPGAAFIITEQIEKAGGKIFYEAVIKVKGKKKEIELMPDGSFVK